MGLPKEGGPDNLKNPAQIPDSAQERTRKRILDERKTRKLIVSQTDVTPRTLHTTQLDKFGDLMKSLRQKRFTVFSDDIRKAAKHIHKDDNKRVSIGMKTTIDDVVANISFIVVSSDDLPIWKKSYGEDEGLRAQTKKPSSFMKIILRESREFVLFEKQSITVPKDSSEAKFVEEDNRKYEYLTVGKGRVRRKAEGEAQTNEVLHKTRYANTDRIKNVEAGTFVSNYDMYDTFAQLERSTTSVTLDNHRTMEITTYKQPGEEDEIENILRNPNFDLAVMLTERLLAGNVFTAKQKRFRNMYLPDPLDLNMKYNYSMQVLWTFPKITAMRKAVSSFCFCPNNGDILAVAYGSFFFVPLKEQTEGYCCIWSIKNPVNPERKYEYDISVTAVQFSTCQPQLLAVGLYNGTVEIRDITKSSQSIVAVSNPLTSLICEPISSLKWMQVKLVDKTKFERLLSVSADGIMMKYYLVNSPYLLEVMHIRLDRIVGSPEGLFVFRKEQFIEANRNPRAMALCLHPEKQELSYILTDEGCMTKCSANFPNQNLGTLQVHEGCVYGMNFSPWSPKLFLTHGSDWCVRIWMDGIYEPLIKLTCDIGPVHCARWSLTHSTIILTVVHKEVQIWDIRRSVLKPVSRRNFGITHTNLTLARFSNCGRSIVVGDEAGNIFLAALEDMPFPPYFQYQELENAIFKAIRAYPELTREVKSLGFFGYPHKERPKVLEEDD